MKGSSAVLVVVLVAVLVAAAATAKEYSNTWVAKIEGGEEGARLVAKQLGYKYGGAIEEFDDHHILTHEDHPVVSKSSSDHLTRSLLNHDQVKWAQQQSYVKRSLRDNSYLQSLLTAGRKLTPLEVVEYIQLLCVNIEAFSGSESPAGNEAVSYSAQPSFNNQLQMSSNIGSPQQHYSSINYGDNPSYDNNNYESNAISKKKANQLINALEESLFNKKRPGKSSVYESSVSQGDLSNLGRFSTKPSSTSLSTYNDVTKNIQLISTKISAYSKQWNDPLWNKQWYLHDYRTTDMPVMDLNVVPVWRQRINGEGIIVGVMDDGVDKDHPDLQGNYLDSESYDYVNSKPGAQPDVEPKAVDKRLRKHGTMCAGAIAMVAGNNYGGVGVAYNAKIIGIKIVGNSLNSLIESYGLMHKWDKIDIYSVSWGAADTGKHMQKIDRLTSMALTKGVVMGRDRKGAVYVMASGNGGNKHDTCGTDFYVNNINMIAVAAASQNGKKTYYSERCTGIFCTTYSGGDGFEEKVVSTDPKNGPTTQFTGTSAAAPLASGIIALVLQANDRLTYRDVMHIIAMGAEVAPLADNGDIWYRNAKGFWVSNNFGFGLLNAENMVDLARKWTTVPQLTSCTAKVTLDPPQEFAVGKVAEILFDANACYDLPQNKVEYLEAVVITSNIKCSYRGALVMHLTSPQGTRSKILEARAKDDNKNGLEDWSIKSVHNWGENPKGTWKLEVRATAVGGRDVSGAVENFSLTFYGTATAPVYHNMRTVAFPRKYSGFRLANGKTSEDPL